MELSIQPTGLTSLGPSPNAPTLPPSITLTLTSTLTLTLTLNLTLNLTLTLTLVSLLPSNTKTSSNPSPSPNPNHDPNPTPFGFAYELFKGSSMFLTANKPTSISVNITGSVTPSTATPIRVRVRPKV